MNDPPKLIQTIERLRGWDVHVFADEGAGTRRAGLTATIGPGGPGGPDGGAPEQQTAAARTAATLQAMSTFVYVVDTSKLWVLCGGLTTEQMRHLWATCERLSTRQRTQLRAQSLALVAQAADAQLSGESLQAHQLLAIVACQLATSRALSALPDLDDHRPSRHLLYVLYRTATGARMSRQAVALREFPGLIPAAQLLDLVREVVRKDCAPSTDSNGHGVLLAAGGAVLHPELQACI